MKRQVSVGDQLYKLLYPRGAVQPEDPGSWNAFVRSRLAREARQECRVFYGEDYGTTVLQPGLDYTDLSHRRRLSRYSGHQRLFLAMDRLDLTKWEIYNACHWDCTAYARDVAQAKLPGVKIDDDTGDDLPTWEESQARREAIRVQQEQEERARHITQGLSAVDWNDLVEEDEPEYDEVDDNDESEQADEDMEDCYVTSDTLARVHEREVTQQQGPSNFFYAVSSC